MHSSCIVSRACLLLFAAAGQVAGLAGPASAQSADELPLPPGQIVTGPVYRGPAACPSSDPSCPGTSVPSIATGIDANAYIFPKYSDPSFVTAAPAAVVLTTAPTQYVRFYTQGVTSQQGAFLVGSNEVRGLTPTQIRNMLALPNLPDMETLVQVPAGTCLLIGPAGPLYGQQGGAEQEFMVGKSGGGAGCGPVPSYTGTFINGQAIGAYALAYAPRAGSGNAGAVAGALDHATPPPLFSDMDGVYNALDVLNFGAPGPLRAALAQLDGEIYADVPSVAIGMGQMFLDVLRDRTHLARGLASQDGGDAWRPWVSGFGGGGALSGNGDSHGVSFGGGGAATGADRRFTEAWQAGFAAAYSHGGIGTSGIPGSGGLDTFALGSYAGYAAGHWYFDGALGYSYNSAGVTRSIGFPGVSRGAFGDLADNVFLSRAETGYRFQLDGRAAVTPFASFQGIAAGQTSFSEGGAGAVDLNAASVTAASAQGVLGGEVSYDLPLGLAAPLGISARAGWAHDYADVNRAITANFQGTPDASFTVNGARWPRDAAAVGARVSLPTQPADLFVRYDGTLAGGVSVNSATAGLRLAF